MSDELIPLLLMVDKRTAEIYHEFMEAVRTTLRPDLPEKEWEDGVRYFNNYIIKRGLKAAADLAVKERTKAITEQVNQGLVIMGAIPIMTPGLQDKCQTCESATCPIKVIVRAGVKKCLHLHGFHLQDGARFCNDCAEEIQGE